MRVQFVAAVILELIFSAARAFGCTCLLAYTSDAATSGSFVFNQVLPGEYWAVVTVAPSIESKWSTRKSRVEVVGDTTHLSLELIAN
jgi:hypothetical protein